MNLFRRIINTVQSRRYEKRINSDDYAPSALEIYQDFGFSTKEALEVERHLVHMSFERTKQRLNYLARCFCQSFNEITNFDPNFKDYKGIAELVALYGEKIPWDPDRLSNLVILAQNVGFSRSSKGIVDMLSVFPQEIKYCLSKDFEGALSIPEL